MTASGSGVRAGSADLAALADRATRARAWLFDAALPLWARAGFDAASGLFAEQLGADARSLPGPRRVRVQARQAFAFAEAGRLGWPGPWRALVDAGLRIVAGPARAAGGAVGHLLDETGALIDPRRDLYDQAFALLALAQAPGPARADAAARAEEILDFLDRAWRSPHGGFAEGELKPAPRRQNPHMHLFEAAMALEPLTPRARPLGAALIGLFDRHFHVPGTHGLREYFNEDWSPAPGADGALDEPGHHFEWVWLVEQWRRRTGEVRSAAIAGLYATGRDHGICARRGVAIDETWIGGGQKTLTARLWPQTERLKAALARLEATGEAAYARDAAAAYDGLALYFAAAPEGLWRDRMDADGRFVQEPAPASSLYHIILALSELMRVAARV
jgi:mannose-6-phosphate isomerase